MSNVHMVWDGRDAISIPPALLPVTEECPAYLEGRDPLSPPTLHGRMAGTTAERLTELAGRTCYDSLAAEKARDSDGFHAHIAEVKHGSVWEHYNFTVRVPWTQEMVPFCFLNRPGLHIERNMMSLRLTLNLRTASEWFDARWFEPDSWSVRIGAAVQRIAHELAPRIVQVSPEWVPHSEQLTDQIVIESVLGLPRSDDEKWISLWLRMSRGCSHELVRHGNWTAISQRSTRYCDESESPWVEHPLISSYIVEEIDKAKINRAGATTCLSIESTILEGRETYEHLVDMLQTWLVKRGADKFTARKQARGAARGYLGNALETEMIFSASVAQWKHMLRMRCSDAADAEIRGLFAEILPILKGCYYGSSFDDMVLRPAADGIGESLA